MKLCVLVLFFCGEAAGKDILTCGGTVCSLTQCCDNDACGVCPAHPCADQKDSGDGCFWIALKPTERCNEKNFPGSTSRCRKTCCTIYTTEGGFPLDPEAKPRHIASPTYAGLNHEHEDGDNNDMAEYNDLDRGADKKDWKYDLGTWKKWTQAARNNKDLHWDVIMGTMYTKHIEKEQKTLERLSNDVKSQLNSMYLGKSERCKPRERAVNPEMRRLEGVRTCATYNTASWCRYRGCEWEPAALSATHGQSPIQISMEDTKNAYTALVNCLRASVSSNDYPTYLDLVQRRGSITDQHDARAQEYNAYAIPDKALFGEDSDLTNYPTERRLLDPSLDLDNHTTDYLLLLKTKQAHYNLQSSYECSNEEMNFEVRLYKMSKLENRYKLLYLYCKCDLTTQIRKFKKMVTTLCTGQYQSGVSQTGHCYKKGGTTKQRSVDESAYGENNGDHWDFLDAVKESECDIDEIFCPENVFYYSAGGPHPHPRAPCSTCVDLGGSHSKITGAYEGDVDHRWSDVQEDDD